VSVTDIRQRAWDYGLTIITVMLLAGLGMQSFIGTAFVWWAQRTDPNWMQVGYADYVLLMNAVAAPMVVALVVVMGLCVPKRLFERRLLLAVSAAMVVAGIVTSFATGDPRTGLTAYLALAALIQVGVVVLTVAGARGPSYLTEGRLTKTGSGLLHLGFIVFAIVVVALQQSTLLMPAFWTSTVLIVGGTALSFYSSRLSWHRGPRAPEGEHVLSAEDAGHEDVEEARRLRAAERAEDEADGDAERDTETAEDAAEDEPAE